MGIEYFKDIDQHIERMKLTHKHWSSGYPWLDKVLGGGFLQDGRAMYVFTGVTNSGKSIVLGNVAVNVAKQNAPVIIISMEMSEDVYAKRISAQLSKIPLSNIRDEGDALKGIALNHITANPMGKIFIKEFAPKSVTVNHIKAYIEKLIQKKGITPGAIVVDYVNLIQPAIETGQSYGDIKAVSEQLRALSYVFNCPVITASQLSRGACDKKDPGLEFISESMGLSMTADFQAAIWSDDNDKEMGIIHMGIQKNRFGINYGTEAFRIVYDSLVIENMKEDFTSSEHIGEAESSLRDLLKDV
jgi:replicative DNA helicase